MAISHLFKKKKKAMAIGEFIWTKSRPGKRVEDPEWREQTWFNDETNPSNEAIERRDVTVATRTAEKATFQITSPNLHGFRSSKYRNIYFSSTWATIRRSNTDYLPFGNRTKQDSVSQVPALGSASSRERGTELCPHWLGNKHVNACA